MNNKELAAALRIVKRFVARNGHENYNEGKARFICFAADDAQKAGQLASLDVVALKAFVNRKIYPEGTLTRWVEAQGITVLDVHQIRHEFLDKWIKELES